MRMIVDTSVWINYFKNISSSDVWLLEDFLDEDRVMVVGIVLVELIRGARTLNEKNIIKQKLLGLPYAEMKLSTWIKAAELSYGLRREGITIPVSDLMIAALATENRWAVYTSDPHFQRIKGLKLI